MASSNYMYLPGYRAARVNFCSEIIDEEFRINQCVVIDGKLIKTIACFLNTAEGDEVWELKKILFPVCPML